MHKKIAVLLSLLLLLIILIIFVWEEEKQPESTPIPTENTTEVIVKKEKKVQEGVLPPMKSSLPETPSKVFTLINSKVKSHKVAISGEKVIFQDTTQPIVLVNLFATWCPPCIGEIPYLNDLQKKYKEELFVAGILTHDTIMQDALESFMAKNQINYFISNGKENDAFADWLATTLHLPKNFPIPLTVIYLKGEYFTHYEGTVPVEMIEYDIQQAKKQLEAR
ncbi:TlpA family protein disulfide reductase [Sulfurovum sp. XGS-02]|uniref:TlpA family protein disulfide reductase n=1 Tax=Sulfurovum sp. XGS-02 TaxID=2925411 RepID=UPI002053EDFC|nr:TlpA disulfide reductase family protein [Sulfurovum sp. XGS-02]UPT78060.1 TlpA family protein disulfide reductase [Sulfurovum sp. XGS-02]